MRTALAAGAHYETSATADVLIAHHLWRQGVLEDSRYMFCNGSKEDGYIDAIVAHAHRPATRGSCRSSTAWMSWMRCSTRCHAPLLLGVRERHPADTVDPSHRGGERFGLTQARSPRSPSGSPARRTSW